MAGAGRAGNFPWEIERKIETNPCKVFRRLGKKNKIFYSSFSFRYYDCRIFYLADNNPLVISNSLFSWIPESVKSRKSPGNSPGNWKFLGKIPNSICARYIYYKVYIQGRTKSGMAPAVAAKTPSIVLLSSFTCNSLSPSSLGTCGEILSLRDRTLNWYGKLHFVVLESDNTAG